MLVDFVPVVPEVLVAVDPVAVGDALAVVVRAAKGVPHQLSVSVVTTPLLKVSVHV